MTRKPVAMFAQDDGDGGSAYVVLCDDGTLWRGRENWFGDVSWAQLPGAIPGTAAGGAAGTADDPFVGPAPEAP